MVTTLLVVLCVLIAVFTVIFHVLMAREGRDHSWATGVYWTLTVMSTLGFGDITFESDAGRIFSVVVLVAGALFILVLLPFSFIQFVFTPWMERREAARAPRSLPPATEGHIVLTNLGPIEEALIGRSERSGVGYVALVNDVPEALALSDRGYHVMVGAVDDPATYRAARVEAAALVATTLPDTTNTNVAFTVREIDATVPIAATCSSSASLDVLRLAGCDEVLQLGYMLGEGMAHRVLATGGRSQVIGRFDDLLVAEAAAESTPLVGRTLRESGLSVGSLPIVVGTWERGVFRLAEPDTLVERTTVLVLAGSADQLATWDRDVGGNGIATGLVVVIGGGRVGRAAGAVLDDAGIDYRIVEQRPERVRDPKRYVEGDAAELEVLQRASFDRARAVLLTTHEDDVNVYLAIYCRKLRPDVQVIARANLPRNVSTLHRAGADAVLSYASLGAAAIWNVLGDHDALVLAEGLDVFRAPMPPELAGKALRDAGIREATPLPRGRHRPRRRHGRRPRARHGVAGRRRPGAHR